MICGSCGQELKPDDGVCPACLGMTSTTPDAPPATAAPATSPENRPRTVLDSSADPGEREALLAFPWGQEPVPPGAGLVIGREDGPLGEQLAEYCNVSRRHARVRRTAAGLSVEDIGSSNGTFVNGQRIGVRTAHPLQPGDEIRFGATLSATVRVGGPR